MDLSKLSNGGKIALGAGVFLIINLFLPWQSFLGVTRNAFSAGFLAWFGSLLAIGGAGVLGAKALMDQKVEIGTLKTEHIALVLGGLGTLLIIFKLFGDFVGFANYLGLIAGAAVTAGAFMSMKEAGLEMPTADDFKSIAGGDDDGGAE